jgi:hypothetical protein
LYPVAHRVQVVEGSFEIFGVATVAPLQQPLTARCSVDDLSGIMEI